MRYSSICSGIETATVAWHTLGWEPVWFSEIAKFPSSVLAHHYPHVPNLGDATKITENETYKQSTFDLLVGGTPCQGFSTAGNRGGMDDPRSRLAWEYVRIAEQKRPRWLVWENVPGVLSSESSGGRDFEAFVGALSEVGYGVCWRILDAQYFGVAQRRRRIFLVGYLGDWRPAAAVLFESSSLRGSSPPIREKGSGVTHDVARCLTASRSGANGSVRDGMPNLVAAPLLAQITCPTNRSKMGENLCHIIAAGSQSAVVTLKKRVRRLTPIEYERLQGFPDDYTKVPHRGKSADQCPEGPRYAACGNSIAVPVLEWIGRRIQMVDNLKRI